LENFWHVVIFAFFHFAGGERKRNCHIEKKVLGTFGAGRERNCRNALKLSGRAPAARLFLGSLFEREILQNLFRIKQNLDVRLRHTWAWGRSSSEKLFKN